MLKIGFLTSPKKWRVCIKGCLYNLVSKIAKENSLKKCVFFTILSKIHSYRLLFWRICPLGIDGFNVYRISATNLVNSILSKKGLRI